MGDEGKSRLRTPGLGHLYGSRRRSRLRAELRGVILRSVHEMSDQIPGIAMLQSIQHAIERADELIAYVPVGNQRRLDPKHIPVGERRNDAYMLHVEQKADEYVQQELLL